MLFFKSKPLLSCLKKKAFTKFEQELLHLANNGVLQFRLRINRIRLQSQELQCDRILYDVRWFLYSLSLFRQAHHLVLIATQSQSLIKTTTNLSIQFTHTPILLFRLNHIEVALIMILNTHKDKIMRPRQIKLNLTNTVCQIRIRQIELSNLS